MDFEVLYHDGITTVVKWIPNFWDKVLRGERNHTATYDVQQKDIKLINTFPSVKRKIKPNNEFFNRIKSRKIR